jgi:folate-binding Fe-S cluster repair protein YgfZ
MSMKYFSKKYQMEDDQDKENLLFKKYNALFKCDHRKVISVAGEDAESFLQSMMTNDIKSLSGDKVSIFSLFLTPKGRVMIDALIVKSHL